MNVKVKASLYWFIGAMLSLFFSLMLVIAVLLAVLKGVYPTDLPGAVESWFCICLMIGLAPALVMLFDNADDKLQRTFLKMGHAMIFKYNIVAAVIWVGVWIYRRFLKPSPIFWLLMSIIIPSQYPKPGE